MGIPYWLAPRSGAASAARTAADSATTDPTTIDPAPAEIPADEHVDLVIAGAGFTGLTRLGSI